MNNEVKEGDTVKAIGNHCWKGREGIVEQVEDVDGIPYIHVIMDNNEKIIMRPGQYKVMKKGDAEPTDLGQKLVDEVLPHIQRVTHNRRYGIYVRANFLKYLSAEIVKAIQELAGEQGEGC